MKKLILFVALFSLVNCADNSSNTAETILFDFSPLATSLENANSCNKKTTEVVIRQTPYRAFSFDYNICSEFYKDYVFSTEPDNFQAGFLDDTEALDDNQLTIYMKSIPNPDAKTVSFYHSQAFQIKSGVTLDSFRRYADTLPEHCKLSETLGIAEESEVTDYDAQNAPRIFEVINTDSRTIPKRPENASEEELKKYRALVSEIRKHNGACGPPRKHFWENGYSIYIIEEDIIDFSTLRMIEKPGRVH